MSLSKMALLQKSNIGFFMNLLFVIHQQTSAFWNLPPLPLRVAADNSSIIACFPRAFRSERELGRPQKDPDKRWLTTPGRLLSYRADRR